MQIFINLSVVNWTPELGRNQVADQVTEGLMHRGGTPPPKKKSKREHATNCGDIWNWTQNFQTLTLPFLFPTVYGPYGRWWASVPHVQDQDTSN